MGCSQQLAGLGETALLRLHHLTKPGAAEVGPGRKSGRGMSMPSVEWGSKPPTQVRHMPHLHFLQASSHEEDGCTQHSVLAETSRAFCTLVPAQLRSPLLKQHAKNPTPGQG